MTDLGGAPTGVCEHGDHPCPEGKRYCCRECAWCDIGTQLCRVCSGQLTEEDWAPPSDRIGGGG